MNKVETGHTALVTTSRPNWYWAVGAFAGGIMFPALGVFVTWLWQQAFPLTTLTLAMYTALPPNPILSGQITFSFTPLPTTPTLLSPLPTLILMGLFLGAVVGRTVQLGPQFSARVLAFVSGCVALLWTAYCVKTVAFLGPSTFRDLWKGPHSPMFLLGWFGVLPFVFPFLCALALLAFSVLARSRPLLKTVP